MRKRMLLGLLVVLGVSLLLLAPAWAAEPEELPKLRLLAERSGLDVIQISWEEAAGADYYELYRKVDQEDSWTKVKNVTGTAAQDQTVSSDHTYWYKVRPHLVEQEQVWGAWSEEASCAMVNVLSAPDALCAKLYGISSVQLSWQAVPGAQEYVVFRKKGEDTWKELKRTNEPQIINYGVSREMTYQYQVYAWAPEDSYSDFSTAVSIQLPAAVQEVELQVAPVGTGSAGLRWTEEPTASFYEIYRCIGDGGWTKLKTAEECSSINYGLTSGVEYHYRVRAVRQVGENKEYGPFSSAISYTAGSLPGIPEQLQVSQVSPKTIDLTWNDCDKPCQYLIYRNEDGGPWRKLKESEENSIRNWSLAEGKLYGYCVRSWGENEYGVYYSALSEPVYYWNLEAPTIAVEKRGETVYLTWDAVPRAEIYSVYVNGEAYTQVTERQLLLDSTLRGQKITVTAGLEQNGVETESDFSNEIMPVAVSGVSRALLIGETSYAQRLQGPENDLAAMSSLLGSLDNDYQVYTQLDATRNEIIDLIQVVFADATEEDVSLFYYSGHGVTGAGEYYSGALQTVDYQYITTSDLAELLSTIPGKVIVLLDSCGSGATISGGTTYSESAGVSADFDPQEFAEGVIDAFRQRDQAMSVGRSQELQDEKFYVLTGSGYEETSLTIQEDGMWGGLFTRGIVAGLSADYPDGIATAPMRADTNRDQMVSMEECWTYTRNYAGEQQHVLRYPEDSDYQLFVKKY